MKLNYSKILTIEDLKNITDEEFEYIKTEAQKHIESIELVKYAPRYQYNYLKAVVFSMVSFNEKAKDIETKYNDKPEFIKTMIQTNIAFPNSEQLFSILLDRKVTFQILSTTIKKVTILKQLDKLNNILNENINKKSKDELKDLELYIERLEKQTKIASLNLEKIISIIHHYYAIDNKELIINKLVQTVVHEQQLYEQIEKHKKIK